MKKRIWGFVFVVLIIIIILFLFTKSGKTSIENGNFSNMGLAIQNKRCNLL